MRDPPALAVRTPNGISPLRPSTPSRSAALVAAAAAVPAHAASTVATGNALTSGCRYRVKSGDTLHRISRSLNVGMDEIQSRNSADLTIASNVRPDEWINIPCPGSSYQQHAPLNIAGCFFDFVTDADHPSILSIVRNPPKDFPGPYSITGIWTANYQALPEYNIDLTAPGQFYKGRSIYLPTCGHSGVILDLTAPTPLPYTCMLDLSRASATRSIPTTLREVSAALRVPVNVLQDYQNQRGEPDARLDLNTPLAIPCPS